MPISAAYRASQRAARTWLVVSLVAPRAAITTREVSIARFRSRLVGSLAIGVVLAACNGAGPATAVTDKPNILFIMGDDMGWMQPRIVISIKNDWKGFLRLSRAGSGRKSRRFDA